jgi:hypothetical protein
MDAMILNRLGEAEDLSGKGLSAVFGLPPTSVAAARRNPTHRQHGVGIASRDSLDHIRRPRR